MVYSFHTISAIKKGKGGKRRMEKGEIGRIERENLRWGEGG